MNEHTAEYYLVPNFISILARRFSGITPFYFWKSREGNSMSRMCDTSERLRFVTVFARRPKISDPGQAHITVKFNLVLYDTAHALQSFGIPVFAGVPAVSTIMSLQGTVPCLWFRIDGSANPRDDVICTFCLHEPARSKALSERVGEGIAGPLENAIICEDIARDSRTMKWNDFINAINEVRYHTAVPRAFWGMGGYKPFYVMMRE